MGVIIFQQTHEERNRSNMQIMVTAEIGKLLRLLPLETEDTKHGVVSLHPRWFAFFVRNAREHCPAHLVKLILEATQVLSAVYHLLLKKEVVEKYRSEGRIYKLTHKHHPWIKFAKQSYANFSFVLHYARSLSARFYIIRKKFHKCHYMLDWMSTNSPISINLLETVSPLPNCTNFEQVPGLEVYHNYRAHLVRKFITNPKRFVWKWGITAPKWWDKYYNFLKTKELDIVKDKKFVGFQLPVIHFMKPANRTKVPKLKRSRDESLKIERKRPACA